MTLPDRYIDQASPAQMYEDAGLRAEDIVGKVLTTLDVSTAEFGKASA
jgi:1-deoxy-D-xylulose-5-phosphate synthase